MSPISWFVLIINVILMIVLGRWWWKTHKSYKHWTARFGEAADLDNKLKFMEADSKQRLDTLKANTKAELVQLEGQKNHLEDERKRLRSEIKELRKGLAHVDAQFELEVTSFEHPEYDLLSSERFKDLLADIKTNQKSMIKGKVAVVTTGDWDFGGTKAQRKRVVDRTTRLALSAFNTQADNLILKVTFKNVGKSIERLKKLAHSINRLLEPVACKLTDEYVASKIEELRLSYRYAERKQREKELEQEHREQQREEAKAQKEAAKALKQAEADRLAFEKALERARAEMDFKLKAKAEADRARLEAHQAETAEQRAQVEAQQAEMEAYEAKLKELEAQLEDAKSKERSVSQAQLTRRGHVYVISNIGSFGEGVYKIGMTRRLDPMVRVHELGDASVPFKFDVHAMIYSEDAPALEAELHRRFDKRRLNRINTRREFFRVSLKEIERAVAEIHSDDIDFVHEPEAKEFFMSKAQAKAEGAGAMSKAQAKAEGAGATVH